MIKIEIWLDDQDADLADKIVSITARDVESQRGNRIVSLARHIADRMGLEDSTVANGMVVDHVDGNPLNNTRGNLELITRGG